MRIRYLTAAAVAVVGLFVGTAVAGRDGALERDTLVRARVWCESVVARDALRYQESFRRGFFRGTFDRFANAYREPSEPSILAKMPRARSCEIAGDPEPRGDRGDVYVPVRLGDELAELRMRRESGFWVVYQVIEG